MVNNEQAGAIIVSARSPFVTGGVVGLIVGLVLGAAIGVCCARPLTKIVRSVRNRIGTEDELQFEFLAQ